MNKKENNVGAGKDRKGRENVKTRGKEKGGGNRKTRAIQ